jgi:hypothetical protein
VEVGAIASVTRAHGELAAENLDIVIDEEKYNNDIVGNWKKRIIDLSDRA